MGFGWFFLRELLYGGCSGVERIMRIFATNARYMAAPVLIIVAIIGVFVGGPWVWTGAFLFGLAVVIDTLVTRQTVGAGFSEDKSPLGIAFFQNVVMYSMLPVFAILQVVLAWRIWEFVSLDVASVGTTQEVFGITVYQGVTGMQMVGAVISSGIFAGIGIIYGHELSHTKGLSFVVSRWIMALSGSAHFCYAHVYNHHLELGSDNDPATAPRGRSMYAHLPISYLGQSKFLFEKEKERLARMDFSFFSWRNKWLRGYAMSLPSLFLFWVAGGWTGIVCLLTVWIISNFELEALNYLEHYGLIRKKGEPIEYRHSWDNSTAFTSWFFIEIGRQADHHDRGDTHFWELDEVGAPNTKKGYFCIFAIALIPPLFHKLMEKELSDWDKNYAGEDELKIAKVMNEVAGYSI